MKYLFYLLFLLPVTGFAQPTPTVSIDLVSSDTGGTVYLAVYQSAEDFDADRMIVTSELPFLEGATAGTMELTVPHTGRFAFAAFHDLNGNGKLDRSSWTGIPKEPYGFVRVPESKFRAPGFEEICVKVTAQPEPLTIRMQPWRAVGK